MRVNRPAKLDLSFNQQIADNMRRAAAKFRSHNANAASLFEVAADTIEGMCDVVKAQEVLIDAIIDTIEGDHHG